MTPQRNRRVCPGQSGFTLIEAMVSIALLVVIVGIIGIMYGVGFADILDRGAAESHIAATSNLIQLEQFMTDDVERATCLVAAGSSSPPGCAGLLGSCQPADPLCLGWAEVVNDSPFALVCQVVRYEAPSSGQIQRQVWSGGSLTSSVTFGTAANPIAMALRASWPAVSVDLSSPGVQHNAPAASFTTQPLPTGPQLNGVDLAAAAPC